MSTENDLETYSLDRKTASRLLKVSIRTIDRYIKAKKLSTSVVDGRVWLDRGEIGGFKERQHRKVSAQVVDMSRVEVSTDGQVDRSDNIEVIDQEDVDSVSTNKRKRKTSSTVYKKLFVDLKEELNEKQERLEIANYRVGQLEAQVKNSIPMLEYHQERFEIEQKEKELSNKVTEQTGIIKRIINQIHHEKFNKRIYLGILLFILALQPLWLLLFYK